MRQDLRPHHSPGGAPGLCGRRPCGRVRHPHREQACLGDAGGAGGRVLRRRGPLPHRARHGPCGADAGHRLYGRLLRAGAEGHWRRRSPPHQLGARGARHHGARVLIAEHCVYQGRHQHGCRASLSTDHSRVRAPHHQHRLLRCGKVRGLCQHGGGLAIHGRRRARDRRS